MALSHLRILADDLSGGADCAASFTGATGALPVFLAPPATAPLAPHAIDLDTRHTDAAAAARAWREAGCEGAVLFKKIDSTLRGHIGVELGAMLERSPQATTVLLTPAFPQQGRTLVDGRLQVHGKRAEIPPLATSLAAALDGQADLVSIDLAMLSDGRLEDMLRAPATRHRVLVADAVEDAHLAAIAVAGLGAPGRPWFAGSSGLARALAGAPPRRVARRAAQGPALLVVGSFSEAARDQVAAVRARAPNQVIAVDPGVALRAGLAAEVRARLDAGRDTLVHLAFESADRRSREPVRALGAALLPAVAACATLLLTGGDTARAMLEALRIPSLAVAGESEPGIPVCSTSGGGPVVVLKAGAFGDNGVLVRMMGLR